MEYKKTFLTPNLWIRSHLIGWISLDNFRPRSVSFSQQWTVFSFWVSILFGLSRLVVRSSNLEHNIAWIWILWKSCEQSLWAYRRSGDCELTHHVPNASPVLNVRRTSGKLRTDYGTSKPLSILVRLSERLNSVESENECETSSKEGRDSYAIKLGAP